MKINITIKDNIINVIAGKKMLEVYNESSTWNTKDINEFLIHCSSLVDEGEKLDLSELDETIENATYRPPTFFFLL
jgi:hypothetical protein